MPNNVKSYVMSIMLAEKIRSIRESQGIDQKELAHKLGISIVHMNHIEKGNRNPSFLLLHAIINKLNINKKYGNELIELYKQEQQERNLKQLQTSATRKIRVTDQAKLTETVSIERTTPLPKKMQALIRKHPEIADALEDPVAVKALLGVHKTKGDVKEGIKLLLGLPAEKRRAILTLVEAKR